MQKKIIAALGALSIILLFPKEFIFSYNGYKTINAVSQVDDLTQQFRYTAIILILVIIVGGIYKIKYLPAISLTALVGINYNIFFSLSLYQAQYGANIYTFDFLSKWSILCILLFEVTVIVSSLVEVYKWYRKRQKRLLY